MKLLGKRVLLTTPRKKESIIELTPEVERQLEMDMIQEWTNLEVYAVGTDVTVFKPGDKVYVSVSSLSSAERIMIGEDAKLMINEFEIAIIWDEVLNPERRRDINASKLERKFEENGKETDNRTEGRIIE
jgi:hypothetical protein